MNPNVKEGVTLVELSKSRVTLNKPIFCGQAILDNSKIQTADFHYNYIKKKYGDNATLCMTDTDSLLYLIKTEDFYKDIEPDIHKKFDTSNYPRDHFLFSNKNKKVPGLMKIETAGKEMKEFAGCRSKQYSYLMDDGYEVKKSKGIKKLVAKRETRFDDYKQTVLQGKEMYVNIRDIRSYHHNLVTEELRKKALCPKDDKRIILEDGISTLPIGYEG